MSKFIKTSSTLSGVLLLALIVGFSSCKSQKKVTDVAVPQEVKKEAVVVEEEAEPVVEEVESAPLTKEDRLDNYFEAIASASNTASANASIQEALTMFGSPEAPVLIVIYRAGSEPDYDEPTTISKYLDYLKDTKNNNAQVEEAVYNADGTIKELVLKKQY